MKKFGILALLLALGAVIFYFTACTVKNQLEGTKWKVTSITSSKSGLGSDKEIHMIFMRTGDFTLLIKDTDDGEIDSNAGTWSSDGTNLSVVFSNSDSSSSDNSQTVTGVVNIKNNVMEISDFNYKTGSNSEKITALTAEKVGRI